jgi:aminoglycoside phosphotransferase family enzyme
MELRELIAKLSSPSAYPFELDKVEIHHTHISVVFLAGPYAYKIKKPVSLGFLDFSTLEQRRHFCEEEVRLNHRLARSIYLGIVPIVSTSRGLLVEGKGSVIEWAVKMMRLPADASLQERLRRGEVGPGLITELAQKVARFHAQAATSDPISAFGRFEAVARNVRENLEQKSGHVGTTLSPAVYDRLRSLTEQALAEHRSLIENRAGRGMPRDMHGDLRLEHVYFLPNERPPDNLVIIDCIEFNERFRYADPVADMAFLVMDLLFHGRRDLAEAFSECYFQSIGDPEGRVLLTFYTAYRAAVRGKVEGIAFLDPEIPDAEKADTLRSARAYWLLAVGELEQPGSPVSCWSGDFWGRASLCWLEARLKGPTLQ